MTSPSSVPPICKGLLRSADRLMMAIICAKLFRNLFMLEEVITRTSAMDPFSDL